MSLAQAIATRDTMNAQLKRAGTLADLHALYVEWIGLGALDEDETNTGETAADELRGILADLVREFCYSAGIRCPDFA